jgi:hypothetical protein
MGLVVERHVYVLLILEEIQESICSDIKLRNLNMGRLVSLQGI